MAPFGVKVLCIEPGFFKTNVTDSGILSKSVQALWNKLPQEVKDDYGSGYIDDGQSLIFHLFVVAFIKMIYYAHFTPCTNFLSF